MKFKNTAISKTSILAIILIIFQLISFLNSPLFMEKRDNEVNNDLFNTEREINDITPNIDENYLKPSKIVHYNEKYNLSDWWNNTYKYRIGFKLENIDSFVRYQPVDLSLTFRENEHYENTIRLVSYNATGNNEWSEPIPIQVWDIQTYTPSYYIKSCKITFLANISAKSNNTYFLYFNDNNEGINEIQYDTDFSSNLTNGKLSVSVGPSGSKYEAIIEEGKGIPKLIRNNINFHSENSLTPERQLTHPSLSLLAHCDEGVGNKVNDSSGNNLQGDFIGDISWKVGIVNNGLEFDGDGDYITFNDVLNNPFGSASKEFTITTWIKPKNLTKSISNYNVSNCFMAKASEPYNDNFELGIYRINETHGLLNLYIGTAGFQNQSIFGDISNPIRTNQWNFIAVKYNEGNVDVRINDLWYTKDINNSEPWEGAIYLEQASGSYFTLGATIDSGIYFNGTMDEIAIYNTELNTEEVEKCKFAINNSSIEKIDELENGEVFSKYQIKWNTIYDMHIEDNITFYYDYNLWNIYRTIYFDNHLDQNKAFMFAMNTYYNLSDISDHQNCKYIYDGIVKEDITSTNFIVENYTIIHCTPDPFNNTIGLFIERYNVSNILQSSINYLKGNINYSNDIVKFTPGSITDFNNSNGGEDFKLIVSFWEYIDSVNQTGNLDNVGISQYFNNTYQSLKKPINIHIFQQNSLKFNLEVYVEDIDEHPVNNAIVSIYSLTPEGKVDSCIATKKTGINGKAYFNKIQNDTYTLNITYQNYGYPAFQIIPKPVNITINDTLADMNDNIYYNFYNISLTTLKLILQRIDPITLEIKESVVNANISFWINNGSGDKYIGYELSDASGKAEFYWLNFITSSEGNISFSVRWHNDTLDISAKGDLNTINNKKITLPFYKKNTTIVNVSSYEFSCALTEYILGPAEFGEDLTFKVNYMYTINYTNPKPINNASVFSYIEKDGVNISSMRLEFSEPGLNGTYILKLSTSNPIGLKIEFETNVIYSMIIGASKPEYLPKTTTILFELSELKTKLTSDHEELEVYWGDNITLNIFFEDISKLPSKGIDGASIYYSIISLPEINGTLTPNVTDGWYELELNSTKFGDIGSFNINITAYKRCYEKKNIIISITIIKRDLIMTLSDKFYNNNEIKIFAGDMLQFEIQINDSISNSPLGGVLVHMKYENKNYDFNFAENGIYIIEINNFKSLTPKDKYFVINATISATKVMFNDKIINIQINVYNKELDIDFSATNLKGSQITITQGNDIKIKIQLRDPTKNYAPISRATVYLVIEITSYHFKETSEGVYEYTFLTDEYDAFFTSDILTGRISIRKTNFLKEDIGITIVIEPEEILAGIPTFYYINLIAVISFLITILIGHLLIRKKKKVKSFQKIRK